MPARPVKLPRLIRLGGWEWRIRRRKLPADILGLSDESKRTMTIQPGQSRLDELDTAVHELFHSILRSQGRPYDEAPEELYVRALATGFVGALNDNPELLAYINASLKP